jgi:hypothetical protein
LSLGGTMSIIPDFMVIHILDLILAFLITGDQDVWVGIHHGIDSILHLVLVGASIMTIFITVVFSIVIFTIILEILTIIGTLVDLVIMHREIVIIIIDLQVLIQ